MASVAPNDTSLAGKAAWLLLVLAAALQVYDGLSSVLLPYLGEPDVRARMGGWTAITMGALQAIVAAAAFVLAARRNLRGATLAVAACMMLGWLSTVPYIVQNGLDFTGNARLPSFYFIVSPVLALAAAGLAWRNSYPVLAALIVTAPTLAGLLFVIVFGIAIAMYGF